MRRYCLCLLRCISLLVVFSFYLPGCTSLVDAESERVLFIGNSYTYYNDVPRQIGERALEQRRKPLPEISAITAGGADLREHLENPEITAALQTGEWDIVVLQGQSLEPLKNYNGFLNAAEGLAAIAKSAGAEVYFYETWARRAGESEYEYPWSGGNPTAMQEALHAAYAEAADRCGARLIPVGSIWLEFHRAHPEVALYRHDGAHPTPQGSYLTAVVLTGYLLEIDPEDVQYLPWGVSLDEKKVIDSFISRMIAE